MSSTPVSQKIRATRYGFLKSLVPVAPRTMEYVTTMAAPTARRTRTRRSRDRADMRGHRSTRPAARPWRAPPSRVWWPPRNGRVIARCAWAGTDPRMQEYHDREWGTPLHDERGLFEFLILEGAQAGLSWSTILNK